MELREIFKLIFKKKLILLVFLIIGALAGWLVFNIPTKFLTSGSFFVKREVSLSPDFFTYEGYYAQQAAMGHTNNVIALMESIDLQSQAMQKIGISVDEKTLKKYSNYIKIKKAGPQLITLTVKGKSPEESLNLWKAISEEIIATTKKTNSGGDIKLTVSQVAESPIVKKAFKSLWINIPVGIIAGLSLGIFLITIKEYE